MRLITRADLDGLTSALLLEEVERIDEVVLAHPKDVQDGKVDIGPDDILANLPRDPRAGKVFDHHASQAGAWSDGEHGAKGSFEHAPSAARVIANHYKSPKFAKYEELLWETDRLDSADLKPQDVIDPQGWILVGYTLDPRTGMARYRDYFNHVLALARTNPGSPKTVLADPQVQERVAILREQEHAFIEHLQADSKADGNVVVTDVRGKKTPLGNRFLVYTVFPNADVSVRVADGADGSFVSIQVGRNIFNRTSRINVGELLARYGGGGHFGAGTAQPKSAEADRVLREIVAALRTV